MTDTNVTIRNLMTAFGMALVDRNGHAYASGYLESLAASIAERLSEDEKMELIGDLAKRVAEEVAKKRA